MKTKAGLNLHNDTTMDNFNRIYPAIPSAYGNPGNSGVQHRYGKHPLIAFDCIESLALKQPDESITGRQVNPACFSGITYALSGPGALKQEFEKAFCHGQAIKQA